MVGTRLAPVPPGRNSPLTGPIALARAGKLALPGDPAFALSAWEAAANDDGRDAELLASVSWFNDQLAAAKGRVATLKLGRIDRERLLRELCGRCNYVYAHSEAVLQSAMNAAAPGSLPMGSLGHLLFRTETGDAGNADALRTGATDALGRALRHLATLPPVKGTPFGVAEIADAALSAFTTLYVLEYYSQKVIWQDWRVVRDGDAWRLAPPAPDPFGLSAIAVDWRREQEHGEYGLVAGKAWSEGRGWPEVTVREAKNPGAPRFIATTRMPGSGNIPVENILRWQIEGSDLAAIQDQPLPGFAPEKVSLGDLVDTVLLWSSAARRLLRATSAHLQAPKMRNFAPTVAADDLIALRAGFGWTRTKAAAVLEFFTYRGRAADGVWSKPLVPLPSGALLPVFSALIGPNLYRSAEIWLAEAGGDRIQQSRGQAFEERVRRDLREAVRSQHLINVAIAEPWSVKINGGRRDIDLAIRIGRRVFIGEQKLKRFAAEPREAARWAAELAKGAEQARLRCDFLAANPTSAAERTGYHGAATDLDFQPFVLASGYFGTGTSIGGVPVIDAEGLQEFFDPGYFGAWGELGSGSDLKAVLAVPLRCEQDDLAATFLAYLHEPVRIRAIERAMVPLPRTVGFPAVDGTTIRCTEMMVDHRRFTDGQALYDDVLMHWNEVRASAGLDELAREPERASSGSAGK